MTRNGKIARLPKAIRDRLNQQIQDGVLGKDLVRWLNGLNEVQDMLLANFNANQITEQNLSEWKQGGYQDWLAHQERRDWARRVGDEAADLDADAGLMPLMERIGVMFEFSLGKTVEQFMRKPVESPEQIRELLELSREVSRHRRLSQNAAQLRLQQEERQKKLHRSLRDKCQDARNLALSHLVGVSTQANLSNIITQNMSPEQKAKFESMMQELAKEYFEELQPQGPGFAEPSDSETEEANPIKSDSIQPDPTSFPVAA